jgi:hypothetical protein
MDAFEKYLKDKEAELARVEEPRREIIWESIQTGLQKSTQRSGWALQIGAYWRWSIAASLAILISLGIWFYQSDFNGSAETMDLAQIYPELAEQEMQFKRLVAEKEAQLDLNVLKENAFKDISEELKLLEEVHQQMKEDLPVAFSEGDMVNILMKYYERKIRILERLSREIEKRKHNEKKQHDQRI